MPTSSDEESPAPNHHNGKELATVDPQQTTPSKAKKTKTQKTNDNKPAKPTKSKRKFVKVHRRKVPRQKLEQVLKIIKDPEHKFWLDRNSSCAEAIHHADNNETMHSELHGFNLKMARMCLMRRDWRNLAKILTMSNPSGVRSNSFLYPLCVKYATICLAHNDEPLLNAYLNSLTSGVNDDVIVRCTQYSH